MNPAPVQNSSSLASHSCTAYRCSATRQQSFRSWLFAVKTFVVFLSIFTKSFSSIAQTVLPDTTTTQPVPVSSASSSDTLTYKQKGQRQLLVATMSVAVYGGSLFALHRAWYKDEAKTSFQVFNDSKEWQQVDKVGHGWTAYNTGRISTALWQWAGMPHKKAVWVGGLTGFIYLTGIEFLDAHSAKWGWSWSDIAANVAGSAMFMGQEFLWKEQRIQYKFSFHKATYKEPMLEQRADDLYGKTFYERMLKDYNAQTYWFSANIKSFFPKSNWPAWLNIAVGYGANGMFGGFKNSWEAPNDSEITRYDIPRTRQYYLAPDIDFTKIKTKSKFLRTTFTLLNAFKCPLPALMIDSKGKVKAYPVFF